MSETPDTAPGEFLTAMQEAADIMVLESRRLTVGDGEAGRAQDPAVSGISLARPSRSVRQPKPG